MKRELLPIVDAKFRRIQAFIDADDERSIRWIEWLGFHREFDKPMRNSGVNGYGDRYVYVRFNDGDS